MTRGSTTQTRTFVYNNAGELTSATNPESGTMTYTYNSDTTLATKVDAKGQTAAYSYDSQKRVTELQWYPTGITHGQTSARKMDYTYGTDPTVYKLWPFGQDCLWQPVGTILRSERVDGFLHAGANPTSYVESYTYHPAGGVSSETLSLTRRIPGQRWLPCHEQLGLTASYTYDSAGRLATTEYPLSIMNLWSVSGR